MTLKETVVDDIRSSLIATVSWGGPQLLGDFRYATRGTGDVILVKHKNSGQIFEVKVSESSAEKWKASIVR